MLGHVNALIRHRAGNTNIHATPHTQTPRPGEPPLQGRSISPVSSSGSDRSLTSEHRSPHPLPAQAVQPSLAQRAKRRINQAINEGKNKKTINTLLQYNPNRFFSQHDNYVANIAHIKLNDWNKKNGYKKLSEQAAIEIVKSAHSESNRIDRIPSRKKELINILFTDQLIKDSKKYNDIICNTKALLTNIPEKPEDSSCYIIGNFNRYNDELSLYHNYLEDRKNTRLQLEEIKKDFIAKVSDSADEEEIIYQEMINKITEYIKKLISHSAPNKNSTDPFEITNYQENSTTQKPRLNLISFAQEVESIEDEILENTYNCKKRINYNKLLTKLACNEAFSKENMCSLAQYENKEIISHYRKKIDDLKELLSNRLDNEAKDWTFIDTAGTFELPK